MNAKSFRLLKQAKKVSAKNSFNYSYNQPGSSPGTISISDSSQPPEISLINYNQNELKNLTGLTPDECVTYLDPKSISWIDVAGLGDKSSLENLGQVFALHPLLLEDIVNVPQRPKIEEHPAQLVIITQMVSAKPQGAGFWLEQVSLVLGENYVLTVQEEPERDCFEPIRQRLKSNRGLIRQQGADYLAYALWDAIIDNYFPILESYGEQLELLENEVIQKPSCTSLSQIYQVRRELLALRRGIWSQRDALNILIRGGNPLMSDRISPYLKDCYDHTVQIIDTIETYRELATGLMDIYLSAVNNKMNEVMKLLTVISSIFIPLTFIAGIYGMNFNTAASPWNMPELNWYWGYPLCLSLMIIITGILITYFWRKGWLKNTSTTE
ncbi:MAG: magnesium/cobalt transporter CorA [Cyanobacteria bacterium P01_A01_bin.40]